MRPHLLYALLLGMTNMATANTMTVDFNAHQQNQLLTISPSASCNCIGSYFYKLSAKKVSASGTSITNQSGRFIISSQKPTPLSTLSFNLSSDTTYSLSLTITNINGVEITAKTLSYP